MLKSLNIFNSSETVIDCASNRIQIQAVKNNLMSLKGEYPNANGTIDYIVKSIDEHDMNIAMSRSYTANIEGVEYKLEFYLYMKRYLIDGDECCDYRFLLTKHYIPIQTRLYNYIFQTNGDDEPDTN